MNSADSNLVPVPLQYHPEPTTDTATTSTLLSRPNYSLPSLPSLSVLPKSKRGKRTLEFSEDTTPIITGPNGSKSVKRSCSSQSLPIEHRHEPFGSSLEWTFANGLDALVAVIESQEHGRPSVAASTASVVGRKSAPPSICSSSACSDSESEGLVAPQVSAPRRDSPHSRSVSLVAPATPPPASFVSDHLRHINTPSLKVTCYHAKVAQKSYGTEKRFLSPPPLISVTGANQLSSVRDALVSIEVRPAATTAASATITSNLVQSSYLDSHGSVYFRHLHVSDESKSKSFSLDVRLDLGAFTSSGTSNGTSSSMVSPLLLRSEPISILSKPSKKSSFMVPSHSGGNSLTIQNGSLVALYSRINSQTVRTKYLDCHSGEIVASSQWTPFTIQLVDPCLDGCIRYDSRVQLVAADGTTSPVLVLRKVDRNRIVRADKSLVGQLHKIALEQADLFVDQTLSLSSASRQFWSSFLPSSSSSSSSFRRATGPADNSNPPLGSEDASRLQFTPSKLDGDGRELLHDAMSWTLVGVDKFEQCF